MVEANTIHKDLNSIMADDDDNFDLDIYGDDDPIEDVKEDDTTHGAEDDDRSTGTVHPAEPIPTHQSDPEPQSNPTPTHGVKRKGIDERPIDVSATTAVQLVDLNWWVTEDEIRGWCSKAGCEHELKDISFNEHKVNGKSKGYYS
jgi:hypothetical protein